jgi:ABC-type nitrate/sulfonate/bicarbonate transport system substrate-binding protein
MKRSTIAVLAVLALLAGLGPVRAAEPVNITFISTVTRVTNLPMLVGFKLAEQDGIHVTLKDVRASEAALVAVADGQGQLGDGFAPFYPAVEKGARVVAVMELSKPEGVVMAKNDIKTPADLTGVKLASHSPKGSMQVLLQDWLRHHPDAKPNVIFMPQGSPARAQALLQGGIDAAAFDLSSADVVQTKAPGKFHVIADFTTYPVSNSFLIVNTDYLKKNPEVVQKIVTRVLESYRRGIADPTFWAREGGKEYFKDMPPAMLERQLRTIAKIYDADGGLARMKGDGAMENIKFQVDAGLLTGPASKWQPSRFFDTRFLETAVKTAGAR